MQNKQFSDLSSESMNTDTFWSLCTQAHILASRQRVVAMLWIMCGPKGLIGHNNLNPERVII